ncbi:MAG: hypothetical protein U1E70_10130 [Acetobacteraceae bacterium]
MMRDVVLGVATALLIATIVVGPFCGWATPPGSILLAVLVAGLLFERRVYKANHSGRPGPAWARTAEQFTDPTTGEPVVVYFNRQTGEWCYVSAQAPT